MALVAVAGNQIRVKTCTFSHPLAVFLSMDTQLEKLESLVMLLRVT
jgi:hypothetical protein